MKEKRLGRTTEGTGSVVKVRVALKQEEKGFDAQLADHHYLGAGRPVGDY